MREGAGRFVARPTLVLTLWYAGSCALIASVLLVSGCAKSELVQVVRAAVIDTGQVERSHWLPPHVSPPRAWPSKREIGQALRRIATPIDDVNPAEQMQLVEVACQVSDANEVLDHAMSVDDYVITRTSTPESYRRQVVSLVSDITSARTVDDAADKIASAALCEWASE